MCLTITHYRRTSFRRIASTTKLQNDPKPSNSAGANIASEVRIPNSNLESSGFIIVKS